MYGAVVPGARFLFGLPVPVRPEKTDRQFLPASRQTIPDCPYQMPLFFVFPFYRDTAGADDFHQIDPGSAALAGTDGI